MLTAVTCAHLSSKQRALEIDKKIDKMYDTMIEVVNIMNETNQTVGNNTIRINDLQTGHVVIKRKKGSVLKH